MELHSIPEPNTGCTLWTGGLNRYHGIMKVDGRMKQAHRVAWELARGAIPAGAWVLHDCGNPTCVNVEHLKIGDASENGADFRRHYAEHGYPKIAATPLVRVRAERKIMDASEVRRILDYDPATGLFRWKRRADREQSWNTKHACKIAGCKLPNGYRYIMIMGKLHLAHRLAVLWMTGAWPSDQVDHINNDRCDNRWENLRQASNAQNAANQGVRTNNTSGVKGVSWDKSRNAWFVKIRVKYKQIALGRFASFDDAVAARRAAEMLHQGAFANKEPA